MKPWNERPRRARAGTVAKWALGAAFLSRVLLLPTTNSEKTVSALAEAVMIAAGTAVIAAALRFALPEQYEEDDVTTPRSLKLLLVCIPIALLLVLSMLGPT